jgi:guanylate kinase
MFILPPSLQELRRRLQGRGKDSPETIERRIAGAREEISHVLEFEYIIVNDRFEQALEDIRSVVRAARASRGRQSIRLAKLIDEFR